MRPPLRSAQEVIINAPLEIVWEFNMDITRIPSFHPRVVKVDLLSGKALREPGVSFVHPTNGLAYFSCDGGSGGAGILMVDLVHQSVATDLPWPGCSR